MSEFLEYLRSYSWVFVVVIVVLAILYVFVSGGEEFYWSVVDYEKAIIRELNLSKELYCVEWSQPFKPSHEVLLNRDPVYTIAWNSVDGNVLMSECIYADFVYRMDSNKLRGV